MERIEVTRQMALKVWWAYTWRFFAIVAAAFVAFAILIVAFAFIVRPGETATNVIAGLIQLVFFFVTVALGVEAMRRVLMMKFDDFEIAVIARQD